MPASDLRVIPAEQFDRHVLTAELAWLGILGRTQQADRVGVSIKRGLFTQYARNLAHDGVGHDETREFAAGKDKIAE